MGTLLNIIRNKKNNQLFVALPRKKLGLNKDDNPKQILIDKIKFKLVKEIEKKKETL